MRDVAAELRAHLVDPIAVCTRLHLMEGAKRQPGGVIVRCPGHRDQHASCSVRIAEDATIACRCMACGWTGDVLSLVAEVRGLSTRLDFPAVLAAAAELAGVSLDDDRPAPRRLHDPRVRMARAIEEQADDWLRGREIRYSAQDEAAINVTPIPTLGGILAELALTDEAARHQRDLEMARAELIMLMESPEELASAMGDE